MFKALLLTGVLSFALLTGCSSDSGSGGGATPKLADKPLAQDCSSMWMKNGREMQYCVRKSTTNTHPRNIIYVLHGLGGDATVIYANDAMAGNFGDFYKYAEQVFGNEMPHLVSISFGPDATLPLENNSYDFQSVNELVNTLMPTLESMLGYQGNYDVPKRHLFGMSLGGFNALNIASLLPMQFASISVVCPALINFDPFNQVEVDAYMQRNAGVASPYLVNYFIRTIRNRYGSNSNFQSRNPIQQLLGGQFDTLPLFISTGRLDDYGFYEGATTFSFQAALSKKNNVQFFEAQGHHCDFNMLALAAFLRGQIVGK